MPEQTLKKLCKFTANFCFVETNLPVKMNLRNNHFLFIVYLNFISVISISHFCTRPLLKNQGACSLTALILYFIVFCGRTENGILYTSYMYFPVSGSHIVKLAHVIGKCNFVKKQYLFTHCGDQILHAVCVSNTVYYRKNENVMWCQKDLRTNM